MLGSGGRRGGCTVEHECQGKKEVAPDADFPGHAPDYAVRVTPRRG